VDDDSSPGLFDAPEEIFDLADLNAHAYGLAGELPSSEPAVDSGFVAVLCILLTAFGRVVFPTDLEVPSEHVRIKFDGSLGIVGGNSKMSDSWHGVDFSSWFAQKDAPQLFLYRSTHGLSMALYQSPWRIVLQRGWALQAQSEAITYRDDSFGKRNRYTIRPFPSKI
jgi:hypothetical protein